MCCFSDSDVGLICLDVGREYLDCIHVADVECISDSVLLYSTNINMQYMDFIQVG